MELTESNNLIIMPNKFQPIFWSSTEDSESPKVWVANFKHRYGNLPINDIVIIRLQL